MKPRGRLPLLLHPAATLLTLASVATCTSPSSPSHTPTSNRRDFYLQLAGFGPTQDGGSRSSHDPTVAFFMKTTWASSYLSVSADWSVNATQLKEANQLGWSVISTIHGSPRWSDRKKKEGKPRENLTFALRQYELAGSFANSEIILEMITEDDSAGVGFPQDLLRLARSAGYTNGATRLSCTAAHDAWNEYVAEAFEATAGAWAKVRRHARVGFPHSTHSVVAPARGATAVRADAVLVEVTNDDVGSLPPAIAFLRGAARQYGASWGVDLSLWWGVIDGCVEDLPASLHRRTMALSYVAGAEIVSVEGCGWVDEHGQPNEMAVEVDRFGSRMLKGATLGPPEERHAEPDTLAVVVVPQDLGWSERPSWAGAAPTMWNYANIPASSRPVAASFDGIMSRAFPGAGGAFGFLAFPFGAFDQPLSPPPSGFARSSIAPPYAPDPLDTWYARPNLPFGRFQTRDQLHEWFEGDQAGDGDSKNGPGVGGHGDTRQEGRRRDPSPHRPMADSRWGDVWDIFVADDDSSVSSSWWNDGAGAPDGGGVVVWSNDTISAKAQAALFSHASAGGTVVVSIGAIDSGNNSGGSGGGSGGGSSSRTASLTGVVPTGEVRAVRAWKRAAVVDSIEGDSDDLVEDHFLSAVVQGAGRNTVQTVYMSVPEQLPVVVRRPLGKGQVYTCLSPFFGATGLDSPVRQLLDDLLRPRQRLVVESGPPTLYWTTSRWQNRTARVVAVANNAAAEWEGSLRVMLDDIRGCEGLMRRRPDVGGVGGRGRGDDQVGAAADVICLDAWTGSRLPCAADGKSTVLKDMSIVAHDVAVVKVSCVGVQ